MLDAMPYGGGNSSPHVTACRRAVISPILRVFGTNHSDAIRIFGYFQMRGGYRCDSDNAIPTPFNGLKF
jgi:hypothetical protein